MDVGTVEKYDTFPAEAGDDSNASAAVAEARRPCGRRNLAFAAFLALGLLFASALQ